MKTVLFYLSLIFSIFFFPHVAFATDVVHIEHGQSPKDVRMMYKREVLRQALEHTLDPYGPYEINTATPTMNNDRAFVELKAGRTINVHFAFTRPEWEKETLPIRIPIRRGIVNYRLLLVNEQDLDQFKDIKSAEQLKRLKAGLQTGWATTEIMKKAGFNVIEGNSYDGMFDMLTRRRFDYFPRGINEIFDEVEQRSGETNNIVIEPTLALYIPAATYIFVSPKNPRLARRIETGLELMIEDGTLQEIFNRYYSKDIEKSGLATRRIINIENPLLPIETPLDRPELWYDFNED